MVNGVYSLPCLLFTIYWRAFLACRGQDEPRWLVRDLRALRSGILKVFQFLIRSRKAYTRRSDLDSLYYSHIIHRHLGLRYPAKKD